MKKSTFAVIAEKAQVGIATVDRVLNERGGVSPKTVQKVITAAKELGIKRTLPEIYQAPWRIELILSQNPSQFFKSLMQGFSKVAQGHQYRNVRLRCSLVPESQPEKLANHLENSADKYDGIIVFANDNDSIYQALEKCHSNGTPVITLATDLPESKRLCHVGIDQYQIGRTAASLMSKMIPNQGEIILLSGRFDYQAHIQRMKGFQDAISKRDTITLSDILYGDDDKETILRLLSQQNKREVIGIYNSGAGNQTIGNWLSNAGKVGSCAFITHELYNTTEELLKNNTLSFALDQNAQQHAELSLDIMFNHLQNGYSPDIYNDGKVAFRIITEENLT
ncbi:LacI family DNA-binding transcriptional regulator [Vibrio sp. EA2]|uniref:LacI family DNA-binding transcriptional regulator n=1 Tax=Vibrio sp. EA2 TaxID=3079860 RepID=UPI002949811E|nr:LacI family DNA-binding transcriptional regulator [Vibrio sp. EA2]MDV6252864.1 LacI family DNA-binding transcriptional regulator [Vibrio sp. EA2]